jgi:SAM-dependent methyltransferase
MGKYQDENIETIERWIANGWKWGLPFDHQRCQAIKKGAWPFYLTPTKAAPKAWLGPLKNKKILGLASGGGQQMVLLSLKGAECTLLDYSEKQIESDLAVAQREGYPLRAIKGDMTKKLPFSDGEFDLVVNPVSLVYAEKIRPIFKEVARVLKKGGIFVGGFDNGVNFLTDEKEKEIKWHFPFNPLKDEDERTEMEKTDSGVEFSHTSGETISALLEAGFSIEAVYEDVNDEGRLKDLNIPTFIAIRALKK